LICETPRKRQKPAATVFRAAGFLVPEKGQQSTRFGFRLFIQFNLIFTLNG
jgi:hypothetical protein